MHNTEKELSGLSICNYVDGIDCIHSPSVHTAPLRLGTQQNISSGWRVAQQIRALAALEEDWSSSPRSLQLPITLAQGDLEAFWFI